MKFIPGSTANDQSSILTEIRRLAIALSQNADRLEFDPTDTIPDKLKVGLLIYANGTTVDPLSTGDEGLYLYTSGGWIFLGGSGSTAAPSSSMFLLMGG